MKTPATLAPSPGKERLVLRCQGERRSYGPVAQLAEAMSSNKEYMREYMEERYWTRRAIAMEALGGVCVGCGEDDQLLLQFDHVDPSTRTFVINKRIAGISQAKLDEELKKCQLLCKECHKAKTLNDLGRESARDTHGTLSSYRYCKCNECKAAKSAYNREYKRKRARNSAARVPDS